MATNLVIPKDVGFETNNNTPQNNVSNAKQDRNDTNQKTKGYSVSVDNIHKTNTKIGNVKIYSMFLKIYWDFIPYCLVIYDACTRPLFLSSTLNKYYMKAVLSFTLYVLFYIFYTYFTQT